MFHLCPQMRPWPPGPLLCGVYPISVIVTIRTVTVHFLFIRNSKVIFRGTARKQLTTLCNAVQAAMVLQAVFA